MKTVTTYEAFDGKSFSTADECRAYEAQHTESRLVGLPIGEVRAALSREDTDLADAIEEIGGRIARSRRAAGDLRREPAKKADAEPAQVAA